MTSLYFRALRFSARAREWDNEHPDNLDATMSAHCQARMGRTNSGKSRSLALELRTRWTRIRSSKEEEKSYPRCYATYEVTNYCVAAGRGSPCGYANCRRCRPKRKANGQRPSRLGIRLASDSLGRIDFSNDVLLCPDGGATPNQSNLHVAILIKIDSQLRVWLDL